MKKIDQNNEEELWPLIIQGDKDAFSTLYSIFSIQLLKYGLKLTRDKELIEDAIHDLFVKIWNKRSEIKIKKSFKIYLFSALRHEIIRLLKKSNQFDSISMAQEEISQESFLEQLLQNTRASESENNLKLAIQKLPARQQEVLYLKYIEGLQNDQIAEIMGIKSQSVYNLNSKSIALLKSILKNKFFISHLFLMNYHF